MGVSLAFAKAQARAGSPYGLGPSASLPDRPSRLRRGSAGDALQRTTPVAPNAAAYFLAIINDSGVNQASAAINKIDPLSHQRITILSIFN
jgi:hypothetical protein